MCLCVHLSARTYVCVNVGVWLRWCVFVRGHLEAMTCPYQSKSGWCQRGRQLSQPAYPHYTFTHTCTHILCPNPHITPHLVMKTSSIIPLDRPQGPKADSSLLGLLFVDWPLQTNRFAAHNTYTLRPFQEGRVRISDFYLFVCLSVLLKGDRLMIWPIFAK